METGLVTRAEGGQFRVNLKYDHALAFTRLANSTDQDRHDLLAWFFHHIIREAESKTSSRHFIETAEVLHEAIQKAPIALSIQDKINGASFALIEEGDRQVLQAMTGKSAPAWAKMTRTSTIIDVAQWILIVKLTELQDGKDVNGLVDEIKGFVRKKPDQPRT